MSAHPDGIFRPCPHPPRALRLHSDDGAQAAVDAIAEGTAVEGVAAREGVPRGHKMGARAVADGAPVTKFGQVAGGCNVMCFTTGRGSAFGCKPTPSIQLATNSEIFRRMEDDMDINRGDILDGAGVAAKGGGILQKVLAIASGARTRSELLGHGESEFVPWQIGATM